MSLGFVWVISLIACAAGVCWDGNGNFTQKQWPFCSTEQGIDVYYGLRGDFLALGVFLPGHKGWSALGLNGNSGMRGLQAIVVKQTEGSWTGEEYWAVGTFTPTKIANQEVRLVFANEDDAGTSWGVLMPQKACTNESQRYPVHDVSQIVLHARGSSHEFLYHGVSTRFAMHLNLRKGPQPQTDFSFNRDFSIKMPNITYTPLTDDQTNAHACTLFKLSDLTTTVNSTDKIVRFEQDFSETTMKYVHHLIVFLCPPSGISVKHLDTKWGCDDMPQNCSDGLPIWGWAKGSQGFSMPDKVAMPLLAKGATETWLALQIHYYKPTTSEPDFVDTSGVKIVVANETEDRPKQAAVYTVCPGVAAQQRLDIPAKTQNYVLPISNFGGICFDEIAEGNAMNVIAVMHHEHKYGTHVGARVIRDGSYVGTLRDEKIYSYDHQSFEEGPVKQIKKGDNLEVTCKYNTEKSDTQVPFGAGSQDEMCAMLVMYWSDQPQTSSGVYHFNCPDSSCGELQTNNTIFCESGAYEFGTRTYPNPTLEYTTPACVVMGNLTSSQAASLISELRETQKSSMIGDNGAVQLHPLMLLATLMISIELVHCLY